MGCCFFGEFTEMYLIILWNNNIKDTCLNFNQFASNIASRTCQGTKDIIFIDTFSRCWNMYDFIPVW